MKLWWLILWLIPAALLAAERPPALRGIGIDQRLDETVPLDLTFRDEQGRTVALKDYFGKRPVILTPVYYQCPMLCTLTLNGLVRAMRGMSFEPGKDYEVVTVSINPRETPELAAAKKKEYLAHLQKTGGAAGWHFLTGEEPAIRALTESVGFHYGYDEASQQYAHAAGFMVLTPDGKISRYFYGVEYSPRDLRIAIDEASQKKIGSLADVVLLFCFHYDAATGRYGLAITRVLTLAASLTVLALGGFVGGMLWRERRKEAA